MNSIKVTKKFEPNQILRFFCKCLFLQTVFEIHNNSLGSQNALCGGGRYDYLVEERLLVAKSYLDNYFKYYQDGELSVKANELKADIEERLQEYS